jgi:hypothetical protein
VAISIAAITHGAVAAKAAPNTISPPKGLNLGSTSFFDGFGRQSEGWTLIEYDRYEALDTINGPTGAPNPNFKGEKIDVAVALTQMVYTSAWQPFGGHVSFSAALPVVDYLQSSFAGDSPVKLANNGTGIGDLVWGPIYQSKIYMKSGRPQFVWRAQMIVSSPTGALDRTNSLNQGVGYWAVNPYVTFSYFPAAKVEVSNRLNYQYNLEGSRFSNPPPIPGLVYRNGQAGQLLYDNFAASYAISSTVNLGVAGYALDQLTPNRTNGLVVPRSRENDLYVGPGAHLKFGKASSINLNAYFKAISNNDVSGPQFNMQFIHPF